jgi:hypothetical protein
MSELSNGTKKHTSKSRETIPLSHGRPSEPHPHSRTRILFRIRLRNFKNFPCVSSTTVIIYAIFMTLLYV